MPEITTRTEMRRIIGEKIATLQRMGYQADGPVVIGEIADYVIDLAPHILSGTVTFETTGTVGTAAGGSSTETVKQAETGHVRTYSGGGDPPRIQG